MSERRGEYYYGSYGLVRGFGPLCRTMKEADSSVYDDNRAQRRNGGCSDRNVVLVSPEDGLCWWPEETSEGDEYAIEDLIPVRTADRVQASYPEDVVRGLRDAQRF